MCIFKSMHAYIRPEVIQPYSCSSQLCMKFIMLIDIKMPTIVGILRCISMINTTFCEFKTKKGLYFLIILVFMNS